MTTQLPFPGDSAPALALSGWLQRGVYEEVRPAGGRLFTVLEFFASWDPLSRHVLARHDAWQAELAAKGVRFLAVSSENPDEVRAYLKRVKLRHLGVACDRDEITLDRYLDRHESKSIPFAFIVREAPAPRLLLWRGPVVVPTGSPAESMGHRPEFETVLAAATEGMLSSDATAAAERAREQLSAQRHDLQQAAWDGRLGEVRERYQQLTEQAACSCRTSFLASAVGWAAWCLIGRGQPSAESAALGLEMMQEALARSGAPDSSLTHVLARALFLNGRIDEAVEAQRAALAQPRTRRWFGESLYRQALEEYERGVEAPPASEPEPPSGPLPTAQAREDLLALHDFLRTHHAAYDDVAWELEGRNSSWAQHTDAFLTRIDGQAEWPPAEFLELLAEYLSVARDGHMGISGLLPTGSGPQRRGHWLWAGPAPFFADVMIRETASQTVIDGAPGALSHRVGTQVLGVPLLGTPETAALDRPYLFPTFPRAGAKHYLLGLLSDRHGEPPPLSVRVRTAAGEEMDARLPLHRGRARFHPPDHLPPWSLTFDPLPVLGVRRMWGDHLEEFAATADRLRTEPVVILDLRSDVLGGGDEFATAWISRFTGQELRVAHGHGSFRVGQTEPLERWDSMLAGWSQWDCPVYGGRLVVLWDVSCESSGETFASFASQVRGALVVGENTGGASAYGGLDQCFDLPHSRFRAAVTRIKRCGYWHRLFREGIGFFPDYWLDTEDPVGAIAEYLKLGTAL